MAARNRIINLLDTFCGAGGSSTGAVFAIEEMGHRPALTCVNHNKQAIATHTINHPWARHYCTGVDDLNLNSMYGDTLLDVLWSSPSCVNHSTARGGTPINEQDRATAWCVVRIAETLRPPVILIENVPVFCKWGPCSRKWSAKNKRWELHPDKSRLGETFQAWLSALRSLGYKVDYKVLCCADYGDPTTRERLFIQCVSGKRKIVWPNQTHMDPAKIEQFKNSLIKPANLDELLPWVPARDIIDWTLQGSSIFEREKSLVEKTLRRIFLGLDRIGLKDFTPDPFITTIDQKSVTHHTGRGMEAPVSTICTENRHALVDAKLNKIEGHDYIVHQMGQSVADDTEKPLSAVVGGPKHYHAEPCLTKLRGTATIADIKKPSPALTGGGTHLGLMQAEVRALLPQQSGGELREDKHPAPTVSGAGAIGAVKAVATKLEKDRAYIVQAAHGNASHEKDGDTRRVKETEKTLGAITGSNEFGVAHPILLQVNHVDKADSNPDSESTRVKSFDETLPTICGNRGEWATCEPYLTPNFGERPNQEPRSHSLKKPVPAVTGHGAGCLIQPKVKKAEKTKKGKKGSRGPDPTLRDLVEKVLGSLKLNNFSFHGEWSETGRPIIIIQGERYLLEIYFRMLQPHELAAAQGFPRDYKFEGNKTEVIKQIGNAVPCNTARALVKAALTQNPNVGLPKYDWIQENKSLTYALIEAHGKEPKLPETVAA